MTKFWKWFLAVLLVLVIVAAVVCAAFFLHNHAFGSYSQRCYGNDRDWGMPMMRGHGYYPLGGGLMFMGLGWLVPLVLVGLVAWGIFSLGQRSASRLGSSESRILPLKATHPCPKCAAAVQEGWKHCPQCGKKQ